MIYYSYYRNNACMVSSNKYCYNIFRYLATFKFVEYDKIEDFNIGDYKRPDIVRVIANKVVLLQVVLPFSSGSATLYAMFQ